MPGPRLCYAARQRASPAQKKAPLSKGAQRVEKHRLCHIENVGATIGRPPAWRSNALSEMAFLQGIRARASNARPYRSFSTVWAPLSKGAGRVSGLGDSDRPCLIARYTRRRPGIPPPRLRSAPPFDKGGFLRGASGTPPTFLVKKLTAQILRFSACKSAPYVVQYKLTKYGKNRRNSKWNTAIRS